MQQCAITVCDSGNEWFSLRGLLLPQNVVEEHGVNRTDGGKLGYGIYFSNSFK